MTGAWDDIDKAWSEGPAAPETVPDGTYIVTMGTGRCRPTKTGRMRLSVPCTIEGGSHSGRLLWYGMTITDNSAPYLRRDIETLCINIARASDLERPDVQALFDGLRVEVTARTKGDFQNVLIKRLLGVPADEAAMAGAKVPVYEESFNDDDLPF